MKFRKKPIVIESIQTGREGSLYINTLEGNMKVSAGDIFEQTYEEVNE